MRVSHVCDGPTIGKKKGRGAECEPCQRVTSRPSMCRATSWPASGTHSHRRGRLSDTRSTSSLKDCCELRGSSHMAALRAGDGIRTRDIQLGKLSLCQLSYTRRLDVRQGGDRAGGSPRATPSFLEYTPAGGGKKVATGSLAALEASQAVRPASSAQGGCLSATVTVEKTPHVAKTHATFAWRWKSAPASMRPEE